MQSAHVIELTDQAPPIQCWQFVVVNKLKLPIFTQLPVCRFNIKRQKKHADDDWNGLYKRCNEPNEISWFLVCYRLTLNVATMKFFTIVFVLVKVALLAKAQSDVDLLETSDNEVHALFKWIFPSVFLLLIESVLNDVLIFVCDSVDDCRIRICTKLCTTTAKLRCSKLRATGSICCTKRYIF